MINMHEDILCLTLWHEKVMENSRANVDVSLETDVE